MATEHGDSQSKGPLLLSCAFSLLLLVVFCWLQHAKSTVLDLKAQWLWLASRDEWQTRILPILKNIPIPALISLSGKSSSMLRRTIAGLGRPRKRNQEFLKSILRRLGLV